MLWFINMKIIKNKKRPLIYRFKYFLLVVILIYALLFIYNSLPIETGYVPSYRGSLIQIRENVRLNVFDSGKGDKTLIFIHGDWMGLDSWKNQIEHFLEDYRIITFDRIDCGDSEYHDFRPTFDTCIEDLKLLIDKMNPKEFVLIGHSRGQQMAALYSIIYKNPKMKGLFLEGMFPPEVKEEKAYSDAVKAKWLNFFKIINLRKIQVDMIEKTYLSENLKIALKEDIIELVKYYSKKWRYEEAIIAGTKFNLKDKFYEINFPVTIINGTDYRTNISRENYAEYFKDSEVIQVDNSAHFAHLENCMTFNENLRLYLMKIGF